MTPIQVDGGFESAEAWSGGVRLGVGRHLVKVVSQDDTTKTKTNDHPQIALEVEAIAGPETGASKRDWITVIPETYGKVKQVFGAFGAPLPEDGKTLSSDALQDLIAWVIIGTEARRDGKGTIEVVKGYLPASDEEKAVAALKSTFGATEVGGAEEDIPF